MTHAFCLTQGSRSNDVKFLYHQDSSISIPTLHGHHVMRSRLETFWAQHFEARGFAQAVPHVDTPTPCYFYEPAGMKRWPTYPRGKHYRVDFVLVYASDMIIGHGGQRQHALKWEWISIKPDADAEDLVHLHALVAFDSLHQRAFQCCGTPDAAAVNIISWCNGTTNVKQASR